MFIPVKNTYAPKWKVGDRVMVRDSDTVGIDGIVTITRIVDTSHLEGTTGQWVLTDITDDWIDSYYFIKVKE